MDKVLSFKAYYLLITYLYMFKKKKKGFVHAFFHFLDPYMNGYQLQDSFPFLILALNTYVVRDMV